jgi:hypothetical protein
MNYGSLPNDHRVQQPHGQQVDFTADEVETMPSAETEAARKEQEQRFLKRGWRRIEPDWERLRKGSRS